MRLSSAPVKALSLVTLVAVFSGCSNPSQGQINPQTPSGGIAPLQLLKMQADGKLPSWVPRPILEQMIDARQAPRPEFNIRPNGGHVALWASNASYDYLLGFDRRHRTVAAINTAANGCYMPFTVKVDRARNVWTACELRQGIGGAVQEYSSAGVLENNYVGMPPCEQYDGCVYVFAYIYDEGNTATTVFGAVSLAGIEICNPTCSWLYYTGFLYWPAGNPSGNEKFVPLPYGKPGVQSVGFMDIDRYGNIWFDFIGCKTRSRCGPALGELVKPTSAKPKFRTILAPGSFDECPEGIYISKKHRRETLNVTDSCTRELYQYHMPVTSRSKPFNVLGPTPTIEGRGMPMSGGFSRFGTDVVQADSYGWLDVGNVSRNAWRTSAHVHVNAALLPSLLGASYTPSDK